MAEDVKQDCKGLRMLKMALSRGYKIDVETGIAYRPNGSVWKAGLNSNGYLHVQGSKAEFGEHFCVTLHKAVAFVKYGDCVFGGHKVHVRHLDGVRTNNKGENIAIGTARDNCLDKPPEVRSDAGRKRARNLGKEALSEILKKANATRGREKCVEIGRRAAEASGSKLLVDIEVAMIRKNATLQPGERMKQRDIAAEFGVKQGTVCDILAGRCYGDVGLGYR